MLTGIASWSYSHQGKILQWLILYLRHQYGGWRSIILSPSDHSSDGGPTHCQLQQCSSTTRSKVSRLGGRGGSFYLPPILLVQHCTTPSFLIIFQQLNLSVISTSPPALANVSTLLPNSQSMPLYLDPHHLPGSIPFLHF